MRNKPTGRRALVALMGFFIAVTFNYALLQPGFGYLSGVYIFVNLCIGAAFIFLYRLWFSQTISELKALSFAVLEEKFDSEGDELKQAASAIKKLTAENTTAIEFITRIGNGELEKAGTIFSEENIVGKNSLYRALLKMRNQLVVIAEKEKERQWTTEGLAVFSEILRTQTEDLSNLCNALVSQLVKYLNANQAAIFVLNDEDLQNEFLELVACYAYEKRKYLTKNIHAGEGLLGQAFLEKQPVYMTDIPLNYTYIKSGLGHSTPDCLLMVPVKLNEEVLGMLEIASFNKLMPYQIEFVEKVSERIASAISTTKINGRTTKLLAESQAHTQALKAQEEEMRQNLEELEATQEASFRMQEELKRNEKIHLERIEELDKARNAMLEQEEMLRAMQEKSQKRSLMFKDKMEKLDIELKGKNAQIKTLTKQLQEIKEK